MVSELEPKLKRSVNALLQIWLLLCGAAILAFALYFNRLSTHTSLQQTQSDYVLYDRQCVEITGFRQPRNQAPFYYPLWIYGQQLLDNLHYRPGTSCTRHNIAPQT